MSEELKKALEGTPSEDILALASSMAAIFQAQVSAGHQITAEERAIFERNERALQRLNPGADHD